eukprot:15329314-Ditylum_brightwellii.AAC.1
MRKLSRQISGKKVFSFPNMDAWLGRPRGATVKQSSETTSPLHLSRTNKTIGGNNHIEYLDVNNKTDSKYLPQLLHNKL